MIAAAVDYGARVEDCLDYLPSDSAHKYFEVINELDKLVVMAKTSSQAMVFEDIVKEFMLHDRPNDWLTLSLLTRRWSNYPLSRSFWKTIFAALKTSSSSQVDLLTAIIVLYHSCTPPFTTKLIVDGLLEAVYESEHSELSSRSITVHI